MTPADPTAWWVWPAVLFLVTTVLGVVTVVGGLGGGTVFVPLVSGFFPFHLDFVRAAGLMAALSGALSAGAAAHSPDPAGRSGRGRSSSSGTWRTSGWRSRSRW